MMLASPYRAIPSETKGRRYRSDRLMDFMTYMNMIATITTFLIGMACEVELRRKIYAAAPLTGVVVQTIPAPQRVPLVDESSSGVATFAGFGCGGGPDTPTTRTFSVDLVQLPPNLPIPAGCEPTHILLTRAHIDGHWIGRVTCEERR